MECEQSKCLSAAPEADGAQKPQAVRLVYWPGRAPIAMCGPCTDRALKIAMAMGLYLHCEETR